MEKVKNRNKEWADFIQRPAFLDNMTKTARMHLPRGSKVWVHLIMFVDTLACTNGSCIQLAPENPYVEKEPTLVKKMLLCMAFLWHEIGHILFTPFNLVEKLLESIAKYRIEPEAEEAAIGRKFLLDFFPSQDISLFTEDELAVVGTMLKEKNKASIAKILHRFENAFEDEWMERLMKKKYPDGLVESGLEHTKEVVLNESEFIHAGIEDIYLFLCRWQKLLPQLPKAFQKEKKKFKDFLQIIADALDKDDVYNRYFITLLFIVRMYSHTEKLISNKKDQQGNGQGSNDESKKNNDSNGSDGDSSKGSGKGEGQSKAAKNGSGNQQGEESEGEEENGEDEQALADILKELSEKEESQKQLTKDLVDEGDDSEPLPADRDVIRIAAKEDAQIEERERKEQELKEKLEKLAVLVRQTGEPAGIKVPPAAGSPVLKEDLAKQAEQIAEEIRDVIMTEESEETDFTGEDFDLDVLGLRGVFQKLINLNDDEQAELAMLFVYDMSGSMEGYRIRECRKNAKIMYEVGRLLHIPTAIIGFRESLFVYADYDDTNPGDVYARLDTMDADNANDDAMALRFGIELIKNRPEAVKVIVMTTDGNPCCPISDLKDAIHLARREQIEVISAAIANDKENICHIYGPYRFLDITDLAKLGEAFAKLMLSFL